MQVLHIYMGDRWNFQGPGSVGNASYVWLPLLRHSDGGAYSIEYTSSWTIKDFVDQADDPQRGFVYGTVAKT